MDVSPLEIVLLFGVAFAAGLLALLVLVLHPDHRK